MLDMILITFKFVAISLWPVMIFPKECSCADEKHVSSATVEQNVLWTSVTAIWPKIQFNFLGFCFTFNLGDLLVPESGMLSPITVASSSSLLALGMSVHRSGCSVLSTHTFRTVNPCLLNC